MSNRFAAGLSSLKQAGKAAPAPETSPAESAPVRSKPARAPSREGQVVISGYFDPAVRKQLAILAIEQERSQVALLADAINLLFKEHGKAPIAKG